MHEARDRPPVPPSSAEGDGADRAPGRLLVVEDDPLTREMLRATLAGAGHEVVVECDGAAGLQRLAAERFDLVLLDLMLPRLGGMGVLSALPRVESDARIVVLTGHPSVDGAVEAMKLGAWDFLSKPVDDERLLAVVARGVAEVREGREVERLRGAAPAAGPGGLIGASSPMRRLFRAIDHVAGTCATVLITGETGTGKELVARAVHDASARSRRPFVAVNCSAIPESLLESELFGHVRGAFTGAARDHRGLIEAADGGTLFLDEVGTLSEAAQVKLLRVLQDHRIQRVGATAVEHVDFRLVAATNLDLREAVRDGRFREDLYYRLAVVQLRVPPLRERRDDVPLLVDHFVGLYSRQYEVEAPRPGTELVARMMRRNWPGNVRELENAVARYVALSGAGEVDSGLLPAVDDTPAESDRLMHLGLVRGWTLDTLEREYILAVLAETAGHRTEAADRLGIDRRTLHRKLGRYRDAGLLPADA